MNNLDLRKMGLQEMEKQEMVNIEGGIKFPGLITAIYEAISDAVDWVKNLF